MSKQGEVAALEDSSPLQDKGRSGEHARRAAEAAQLEMEETACESANLGILDRHFQHAIDAAVADASGVEIVCDSCGGTDRYPEKGDGRCRGCGMMLCQSCCDTFDHWGDGLHGKGNPGEEAKGLRAAVADRDADNAWLQDVLAAERAAVAEKELAHSSTQEDLGRALKRIEELERAGDPSWSACLEMANDNLCEEVDTLTATRELDAELLSRALRQICVTRDYVGAETLPAIEGWEWFDVGRELAERIPDDEWAYQFRLRLEAEKGD